MSDFESFMFKKIMNVDHNQFQVVVLPNNSFVSFLDAKNRVDTRFRLLREILEDMDDGQKNIDYLNNLYNEFESLDSSADIDIAIKLEDEDLVRLARVNDRKNIQIISGIIQKDEFVILSKTGNFIKNYTVSYDNICNGLSSVIKEITGKHVMANDRFAEEADKEFEGLRKESKCLIMNNRKIIIESNHFDMLKKTFDENLKAVDNFLSNLSKEIWGD